MIAAATDLAGPAATAFSPWALVLGALLLVTNGAFTAAEISLLATRRGRIEEAAEQGNPAARSAMRALTDLPVTFSGTQLGVTMSSLGLGAIAEPAVAAVLAQAFGRTPMPPGIVPVLSVVVALAIVVFLHMVIGDMAPKNLALARAEDTVLRLARPFGWFVAAFRPVILVLNLAARGVLRVVRVEPVAEHKLVHTPEELALVLSESSEFGTIQPQDARVIGAALGLASIDAQAAMTPRVDVVGIDVGARVSDLLELAADCGHTRFPVLDGDVDEVVGVVHVKDALVGSDPTATVGQLMRPVTAVPASLDLEALLHDMLAGRRHMLLVVDEFGDTAGVLTLEDVLEELVGDIDDEFDEQASPVRPGTGVWVVPGTMRRDELGRLAGVELEDVESETVSGWMVEQLGRLLEAGDVVTTPDGWRLEVVTLDGHRAGQVEVRPPADPGGPSGTSIR